MKLGILVVGVVSIVFATSKPGEVDTSKVQSKSTKVRWTDTASLVQKITQGGLQITGAALSDQHQIEIIGEDIMTEFQKLSDAEKQELKSEVFVEGGPTELQAQDNLLTLSDYFNSFADPARKSIPESLLKLLKAIHIGTANNINLLKEKDKHSLYDDILDAAVQPPDSTRARLIRQTAVIDF